MQTILIGGLFFASGLAALLLQTLWLRKIGWLLGATATGATIVLVAFFLGLAIGGFWSRRGLRRGRPLLRYASLEAVTGLCALLFLLLERVFLGAHGLLVELLRASPLLYAPGAFCLVLPLLLPATICMGATLPVMSEFLAQSGARTSERLALVYGANTIGGGAGVCLAGFVLPRWFGYTGTYVLATGLIAFIALAAFAFDRFALRPANAPPDRPPGESTSGTDDSHDSFAPGLIAFVSGFVTLACEVLWIRLFSRILQNSIYTYSVILLTVLLGLAGGAFFAAFRNRRTGAQRSLPAIMTATGLLILLSPFAVHQLTGDLAYFGGDSDWYLYLMKIMGLAAVAVLPAALLAGTVFPLLFAAPETSRSGWQKATGGLLAINTIGAIAGTATAGFLLLPALGLHAALRLIALVYPVCALVWIALAPERGRRRTALAATATIFLGLSLFDPGRLATVRYDPERGESLVEALDGPRGQSAVIRAPGDLRIKLDNHYTIGGSSARAAEERQAHLPLLLHPNPERVFVLGLGTGITAGTVLRHPVSGLEVAELVPEIIELSRRHFQDYTGDLFKDERARVVAADGRWLLRAQRKADEAGGGYDVILADLFTPWKAGVGDLYTREHFENVRARLKPGGVFAQWLPLFQMTEFEYGVVARTMLEVFPRVTLWRGDFFPKRNIVALVGHADRSPLGADAARRRLRQAYADERDRLRALAPALAAFRDRRESRREPLASLLMYYGGDLTERQERFRKFPASSDDRPVIQWRAPISHRRIRAGRERRMGGELLLSEFDATLAKNERADEAGGDYLQGLAATERRYVQAGNLLHRLVVLEDRNEREAALKYLRDLKKILSGE